MGVVLCDLLDVHGRCDRFVPVEAIPYASGRITL
jgi:hypothetical protein